MRDGATLALGAAAGLTLLGALRSRVGSVSQQPWRFSGLTCPSASAQLVDWSTDSWWYPVPVQQIGWQQFRRTVRPEAQDVAATELLGWKPGWEPFAQFLATEPGGGTQAWYRGRLPSGQPVYVWVGSGIEHWWTPGGVGIDVQEETARILAAEQQLEALAQQRQVTLDDTLAAVKAAR